MSESRSGFVAITEKVPLAKDAAGVIATQPFLSVWREVLPVLDKLGTGLALVKSDVGGNIDRLSARQQSDPPKFAALFSVVKDEVARGEDKGSRSCTKGLLWLKRAMEFVMALLQLLYSNREVSLAQAADETYRATIYKYHTWITSTAFVLAMKLLPSREVFLEQVAAGASSEQVYSQMKAAIDACSPLLSDVNTFLVSHGLDDPTKV